MHRWSPLKASAQVDDIVSRDDEYSRYIKERVEWVEDPIAKTQISQFGPDGPRYALNSMHPADVERLFSSCGLTLEDRRSCIAELLEALECLKSWQKIKELIYWSH
jgi:hypothetical protein